MTPKLCPVGVGADSFILLAKEEHHVHEDVERHQYTVRIFLTSGFGLSGGYVADDPRRILVPQESPDASDDETYDKQPGDGDAGKPKNPAKNNQ